MKIVFHLGLHCTDGGLLLRSLLQNKARLGEAGISVPGPRDYREVFGETSTDLRGESADAETEGLITELIAPDPSCHRVFLSNENFLCRSDVALGADCLYPKAEKSAWLRNCVPSHDVEFALALRSPATLLPDLMAGLAGPRPRDEALSEGVWLDDLSWADVIERIRAANPTSRIIVWCHEDTPFLWPEIQREVTGLDAATRLDGALDMVETIISPEGFTRLSEFLTDRAVLATDKQRRAIAAFLEAHAVDDAIEAEIDMPGWTDETIETLNSRYEDDIEDIAAMPGVTLLTP